MLRSSNEALHLARDMALEVTDMLVFLQHGHFLLTTARREYAHKFFGSEGQMTLSSDTEPNLKASSSWHRLDELTSDLLALSIHGIFLRDNSGLSRQV